MDKKTATQATIVVVGVIILVLNFMRNMGMFSGGGSKPKVQIAQSIDNTLVAAVESSPLGSTIQNLRQQMVLVAQLSSAAEKLPTPVEVLYTAEGLRDPFVSLLPNPAETGDAGQGYNTGSSPGASQVSGEIAELPTSIAVSGLMLGGENPVAIINHKVYSVGDVVQGAKIRSITYAGVTVEYQGMVTVLPVQQAQTGF